MVSYNSIKLLPKRKWKEFILQQSFRLLAESFIKGGWIQEPATLDMKGTEILYECELK